jgi:hypothetical protein
LDEEKEEGAVRVRLVWIRGAAVPDDDFLVVDGGDDVAVVDADVARRLEPAPAP